MVYSLNVDSKEIVFLAFLQIENDFINITNGFHLNLAIKHNCCLNFNYLHIFSKMIARKYDRGEN